jgi:hypothetical protein
MKKILWLDDDESYITEFSKKRNPNEIEVFTVLNVSDAEIKLLENRYDLVIIDPGIPTINEEEEKKYTPEETNKGHETGFVFYLKNKEYLKNSKVFMLAIQMKSSLKNKLMESGIPENHISSKFALRDPYLFWKRIKDIIGDM